MNDTFTASSHLRTVRATREWILLRYLIGRLAEERETGPAYPNSRASSSVRGSAGNPYSPSPLVPSKSPLVPSGIARLPRPPQTDFVNHDSTFTPYVPSEKVLPSPQAPSWPWPSASEQRRHFQRRERRPPQSPAPPGCRTGPWSSGRPAPPEGWTRIEPSGPDFLDFREKTASFDDLALAEGGTWTVTGFGEPRQVPGARVSNNFLSVLGVKPILGRDFLPT